MRYNYFLTRKTGGKASPIKKQDRHLRQKTMGLLDDDTDLKQQIFNQLVKEQELKKRINKNSLNSLLHSRKKKKKSLKKTTSCKFCGSFELSFQKWVFVERKHKVFHYKAVCNSCKKTYFVKRSKKVYQIVKNQNWCYPK